MSTPPAMPIRSGWTMITRAARVIAAETEWVEPVYPGEQLYTQSSIVDIVARQGKAGVGIYISQEEQVLNSRQQIVLRRRHTLAVFPDKKFTGVPKDVK